jgi:hypothetical protein
MRTGQGIVGRRHNTWERDVDLPSMNRMAPSPASGLSGETADDVRTATIIDGRGRAGKTTVANVFRSSVESVEAIFGCGTPIGRTRRIA